MRGQQIPPFYATLIGRRAFELAQTGKTIIPMHFGQPTAGAPPAALAAARRALDDDAHYGYWESTELPRRLAERYASENGVEVSPSRILLTAGASGALVAAFAALFRRGDRIAITRPGYPAYRNTLTGLGLVPVEIDCHDSPGMRPTAAMLERLDPAPAGFVLSSPANPTGAMVNRPELEAIVAVCRARGIRLISDEIYHGITFARPAVSALEADPQAIVINSFSKRYRMPGWRLGWLVAPESLVRPLHDYLLNFFLTPPSIAQHAALAALDETAKLERSAEVYRSNRALLVEALPKMGFTDVTPPDGAFYFYAGVSRHTNDSLDFCMRLLEDTGVAIAPGIDFDPALGKEYVRFSFAVSMEETRRAVQRVGEWMARGG